MALGRCCSCNHQERWWGRRQSQRAPSSLFVEHWRSKVRNNGSLHSAIKGAEPRENSRRINRLFLGLSEVLHTEHKMHFGKRRGNCPAPWLGLVTASCSTGEPSWSHGLRAGQKLPQVRSLGAGAEEEQVGHLAGYRVTFTPSRSRSSSDSVWHWGSKQGQTAHGANAVFVALGPVGYRISSASKTRQIQKVAWHFITSFLSHSCLFM